MANEQPQGGSAPEKKTEPSGAQLRNADVKSDRVEESYLIRNARALFGVRPTQLAGALATSGRVNSSPEEAKAALREYQSHTVSPLQGTPQEKE